MRMISTAQTGYFYTTQRLRIGPTLAAVKYDPRGKCFIDCCARLLPRTCLVKQRVLFVESRKTAKK